MSFLKKRKITSVIRKFLILLGVAGSLGVVFYFLYIFTIGSRTAFISPLGRDSLGKLELERTLHAFEIPFIQVSDASGSAFFVELTDSQKVTLSSRKDINLQISSLQLILKQLTIEGKRFKTLNFTFDKPIISF